MKLIIIDRKAWERHCSDFADFVHRIEQFIGNPPIKDEWLDNEAVCKCLGISKRTLQSYRDTGSYFMEHNKLSLSLYWQGVSLYHKLPFVPQRPLPQLGD